MAYVVIVLVLYIYEKTLQDVRDYFAFTFYP